jgi:hypothetical protein
MKDRFYWTELRAALVAGKWAASSPASSPSGTALTWSEILRKFNKHCAGSEDIAEIANRTQALALLLGIVQDKIGSESLTLGNECVLPQERIEEAEDGYKALKNLKSSNFDVRSKQVSSCANPLTLTLQTLNFALAYYAYALGRPSQCLSHLAKIPDMDNISSHIPVPPSNGPSADTTQSISGTVAISTASSGGYVSLDTSSISQVKDGRAWAMTETVRSLCLQGMHWYIIGSVSPHATQYKACHMRYLILETRISSWEHTARLFLCLP